MRMKRVNWGALRGLWGWEAYTDGAGFLLVHRCRNGLTTRSLYEPWEASTFDARLDQMFRILERALKRRPKPEQGTPKPPHAEYADLLELYPNLAGWMTDSTFDDGEPRLGGWFCVSCRGGSWHATLKDAGESTVLTIAAPTAQQLLAMAEHAIADPSAPWRHDPAGKAPSRKKGG